MEMTEHRKRILLTVLLLIVVVGFMGVVTAQSSKVDAKSIGNALNQLYTTELQKQGITEIPAGTTLSLDTTSRNDTYLVMMFGAGHAHITNVIDDTYHVGNAMSSILELQEHPSATVLMAWKGPRQPLSDAAAALCAVVLKYRVEEDSTYFVDCTIR